jgi:hypothetical protein
MLRDKNFYLRIFAMLLLAGGIFASLIAGNVHATPLKNPPRQITGPHLTLVKTATTNYSTPPVAGDTIDYTLLADNDGDVPLTLVNIADPNLGALTCTQPVNLAATEQLSCTGSYTLKQSDIVAGSVSNTATVTGTPPTGADVTATATLAIPTINMSPHLTLVKTATTHFSTPPKVGDTIDYTLVATNDGDVPLTSVSIIDPKLGALTCTQPVASLAPNAQLSCTGSYTLKQSDIDAGSLSNTATVTGTPPAGPAVTATAARTLTLPVAPTRAPTATPSAPHHIVISEFRTTGPLGASDEFVELYNPTGAAVNIGYWTINISSSCGISLSVLVYIDPFTILQPGQHYLVAAYGYLTNSSISTADQRFNPGIADDGGIALVSSGIIVDQVGMCASTRLYEGTPLPPLPAPLTTDQSYERKPGGNTSCYDTDNNIKDFKVISPSEPLAQSAPAVMCQGVLRTSPTRTPTITQTRTRTLTRVPTPFPAYAVLNEFLPHPQNDWNADGVANVGDEYIEVINLGSVDLNMKGWRLDTGLNSPTTYTLPDTLLKPRGIAVFFGSQTGISLSDGGGTVRLLRTDGRIFDAFTYPAVEVPERTWCRLPDGGDRWGFNCRPTPSRPNISITATPVPGTQTVENPSCPQINTAPQPLVFAECGGFGARISGNPLERIFWLQDHWKWGVFVQ